MGLRVPVIISSVNNLSDARYAAGMGVEWIGFQIDENSERYVSPELFKAITSWVSGVQTVAEIVVLNPETLQRIQQEYQPDFIQYEKIENLTPSELIQTPCIRKISCLKGQELTLLNTIPAEQSLPYRYILIDLQDWSNWRSYSSEIKTTNSFSNILWALPITKEDAELINSLNIQGLSLKGGNEQRPGWKDLDEMIDILEALEEN